MRIWSTQFPYSVGIDIVIDVDIQILFLQLLKSLLPLYFLCILGMWNKVIRLNPIGISPYHSSCHISNSKGALKYIEGQLWTPAIFSPQPIILLIPLQEVWAQYLKSPDFCDWIYTRRHRRETICEPTQYVRWKPQYSFFYPPYF